MLQHLKKDCKQTEPEHTKIVSGLYLMIHPHDIKKLLCQFYFIRNKTKLMSSTLKNATADPTALWN